MKKIIAALCLALAAAIGSVAVPSAAEPVEARASYCYLNHGYNFATVECHRGNYGDVYRVEIRCKKTVYFWTYYVTATGNNAYVGYGGSRSHSFAQCPNRYHRDSGGYIYT